MARVPRAGEIVQSEEVGGARFDAVVAAAPEDQVLLHADEAGLIDELLDFVLRRFRPATGASGARCTSSASTT